MIDPSALPLGITPTPLAAGVAPSDIPAIAAAIPSMIASLNADRDAVAAAAKEAAASHAIELAKDYVAGADQALADVDQTKRLVQTTAQPATKAVAKAIDSTKGVIDAGYTTLWESGIRTPVTLAERATDLEDTSGQLIGQRFTGAAPGLAPVTSPTDFPVTIDPISGRPVVPPMPGPTTGTTSPDPIANPAGRPPLPQCERGQYPWWDDVYQMWRCLWPDGGWGQTPTSPPVGPTTPTSPPVGPTTPTSPIGTVPTQPTPPPIGTSPPIGTAPCDDASTSARLITCYTAPPIVKPIKWWVTADCTDQCNPKVCVWSGTGPPVGFAGSIIMGPTDAEPNHTTINTYLLVYCPTATPVSPPPPIPPPTPPPTSPPPTSPTSPPTSPPPAGTPGEEGEAASVNWALSTACDTAERLTTSVYSTPDLEAPRPWTDKTPGNFFLTLGAMLVPGALTFGLGQYLTESLDDLKGSDEAKKQSLGSKLLGIVREAAVPAGVVNPDSGFALGSYLAVADRVETFTGFPLRYLTQSVQYTFQYANPQYIPTQADVDGLYLTNQITASYWECLTKAHGNIPELATKVLDAKERKPDVDDILRLYMRGEITTWKEAVKRCRERGVLSEEKVKDYYLLLQQYPVAQELTRYMVRDVFDPDVVLKYDLDAQFTDKWTDDAKRLGTAIGITTEKAKLDWRAHWHTPSDTALYVMQHRLRPDRPEVKAWDLKAAAIGAPAATLLIGERPPTFTMAELKYALKINDNLPTFVDSLAAIAYHPVTPTDGGRMYQAGFITDDDLTNIFQDNGYTKTVAEQRTKFERADRSRKLANVSGVWSIRRTIATYKDGLIDRRQADDLLAPLVLDESLRRQMLNGAELEVRTRSLDRKLKGWKKRYLYGEFEPVEMAVALRDAGVDPAQVGRIVDDWTSERTGHVKEPRAQWVCDWLQRGFINKLQYVDRMRRLGYSDPDIANMLNTCGAEGAAKMAHKASAAANAAKRQHEAELREARRRIDDDMKAMKMEEEAITIRIKLLKEQEERLKWERMQVAP